MPANSPMYYWDPINETLKLVSPSEVADPDRVIFTPINDNRLGAGRHLVPREEMLACLS
jgi:hypothetical protein